MPIAEGEFEVGEKEKHHIRLVLPWFSKNEVHCDGELLLKWGFSFRDVVVGEQEKHKISGRLRVAGLCFWGAPVSVWVDGRNISDQVRWRGGKLLKAITWAVVVVALGAPAARLMDLIAEIHEIEQREYYPEYFGIIKPEGEWRCEIPVEEAPATVKGVFMGKNLDRTKPLFGAILFDTAGQCRRTWPVVPDAKLIEFKFTVDKPGKVTLVFLNRSSKHELCVMVKATSEPIK